MQRDVFVAPAQAGAQGSPPDVEVTAPDPRFREDDGGSRPTIFPAQNPLQPEPLARQAKPADEQLPHRRWEDLTEAEQFAILYPERAAAGATSHEDIDLWLTRPGRPAAPARTAR